MLRRAHSRMTAVAKRYRANPVRQPRLTLDDDELARAGVLTARAAGEQGPPLSEEEHGEMLVLLRRAGIFDEQGKPTPKFARFFRAGDEAG
jgi:hypothetical protein